MTMKIFMQKKLKTLKNNGMTIKSAKSAQNQRELPQFHNQITFKFPTKLHLTMLSLPNVQ